MFYLNPKTKILKKVSTAQLRKRRRQDISTVVSSNSQNGIRLQRASVAGCHGKRNLSYTLMVLNIRHATKT